MEPEGALTVMGGAMRALDRYGPWAAVAAFLIWWMTNDISGDVRAMRQDLADHVREANFYQRQICINTARDETQRANCQPMR